MLFCKKNISIIHSSTLSDRFFYSVFSIYYFCNFWGMSVVFAMQLANHWDVSGVWREKVFIASSSAEKWLEMYYMCSSRHSSTITECCLLGCLMVLSTHKSCSLANGYVFALDEPSLELWSKNEMSSKCPYVFFKMKGIHMPFLTGDCPSSSSDHPHCS